MLRHVWWHERPTSNGNASLQRRFSLNITLYTIVNNLQTDQWTLM